MFSRKDHETAGAGTGSQFTTTHWSVVLAAADPQSPRAVEALEQLCRAYWYPLYAFVRREGHSPEDAQDLTQSFFAHLLARDFLEGVRPEKGRFRSFLPACLKHFLADRWDKGHSEKRGGGQALLSLDDEQAETRSRLEPADPSDPEMFYEQRWALNLLDRVLDGLRGEYAAAGKPETFQRLEPFLLGDKVGATYAEVAASLGSTEAAITMMVYRMRQRYRALFREEIAQTVASAEEVNQEMGHLLGLLSR